MTVGEFEKQTNYCPLYPGREAKAETVEENRTNSMNRKMYVPVGTFEQGTSYCPIYIAWQVLDEARDYFRTELIPSRKRHRNRPSATFSRSRGRKTSPHPGPLPSAEREKHSLAFRPPLRTAAGLIAQIESAFICATRLQRISVPQAHS